MIYKLSSCILGSMLLLTSCIKDKVYPSPDPDSVTQEKVNMRLYTDAEEFQQPLSRVADENEVAGTMPWVFVFNNTTGNFIEVEQASPVGSPVVPYVMLTNTLNPVRIVIVANAPATFRDGTNAAVAFNKENLTSAFSATNYAGFISRLNTSVIAALNTIPYDGGYLPMVGETTLSGGIGNTSTIGSSGSKIPLTRIVAKVTVNSTAAGFTLAGWNVINTRNSTALYTGSLPGSSALISFDEGLATESGTNSTFYIYPSQSADNTTIIVKGTLDGGTTYHYYRLRFRNDVSNNSIAVERNKHYTFNITGVDRLGYNTYLSAINATAGISNNVLSVNYSMSVTDISSNDIKDNGTFFLGTSNSRVIFYDVPITMPYVVATISTNATSTMLIESRNSIMLTDVIPVGSPVTISPSSLTLNGQTNITISGMTSTFQSAKIIITLGDLVQEIDLYKMSLAGITNAAGGVPLMHDVSGYNYYTSAEVINEFGNPWLFVATDQYGAGRTTYYSKPALGLTDYLYVYVLANTGPTPRDGEIFLSHKTAGRVKVYVRQIGT